MDFSARSEYTSTMSSTVAVDARPPLSGAVASSMVVAVFIVLVVVSWVLSGLVEVERHVHPTFGGYTTLVYMIFMPWLLFAGFVAMLAVRSSSEAAVTATAMVLPSIYVAVNFEGYAFVSELVLLSLAPALAVFLGVRGGSAVLRPGGADRTIAGFLVAGALSFIGAASLFVPAVFIEFSAWV